MKQIEVAALDASLKKEILKFLHDNPMAAIATIDAQAAKPESALIAFAELDTFEFIFETFYDTRKYHNLRKNDQVAFVVGWDTEHHITIQYEGRAEPIPEEEVEEAIQVFLKKDTPCTEKFLRDARVRLYKVSPDWLRFSDYTSDIPKIFEITF